MHKIEIKAECDKCGGTGLYSGMGESDEVAVVCHRCKGTGERLIVIEYKDFTGRKERPGTLRVIEWNPGIKVGGIKSGESPPNEFGGMDYDTWKVGMSFLPGMEMRKYTCPSWWYQGANYKKKPDWNCCPGVGRKFSSCTYFDCKASCWTRWDEEHGRKANQEFFDLVEKVLCRGPREID